MVSTIEYTQLHKVIMRILKGNLFQRATFFRGGCDFSDGGVVIKVFFRGWQVVSRVVEFFSKNISEFFFELGVRFFPRVAINVISEGLRIFPGEGAVDFLRMHD